MKKYILPLALVLLTFGSASAGPLLPGTYVGTLPIKTELVGPGIAITLETQDERTGYATFSRVNPVTGALKYVASGGAKNHPHGLLRAALRRGNQTRVWLHGKVSADGSVIQGRLVYLYTLYDIYGGRKQKLLMHRFELQHVEEVPPPEVEATAVVP